jgi:hypothetical protein
MIPAMCPKLVQDALKGENVIEWVPVEPKGPQNEDYVTPGERRLYRVPSVSLLGASRVKITVSRSEKLITLTSRQYYLHFVIWKIV